MTQEPLALGSTETVKLSTVSPAIAKVMTNTNQSSGEIIRRFKSEHTNLFLNALHDANALIGYILGTKEADPADFSRIISLKKQLRNMEAANDDSYWNKTENETLVQRNAANDENYVDDTQKAA